MKHIVIDNFLEEKKCQDLISSSNNLLNINSIQKIHGNRLLLTSTSKKYNDFINQSKIWKELHKKITEQSFFNFCVDQLNLDVKSDNYCNYNFYNKTEFSNIELAYKKLIENEISSLKTSTLAKIVLFRLFKNLEKKILFFKSLINKKKYIELLYDYSQSGNGYSREIHRDSDSRLIVFLLYLNDLDDKAIGGNLEIYKLKSDNNKDFVPRPKYDDCILMETIKPKTGRLVIFSNTDNSYHAVSQMKGSDTRRHFLYGGFSLLVNKNKYISSNIKTKTDFDFYL